MAVRLCKVDGLSRARFIFGAPLAHLGLCLGNHVRGGVLTRNLSPKPEEFLLLGRALQPVWVRADTAGSHKPLSWHSLCVVGASRIHRCRNASRSAVHSSYTTQRL